MTQPPGTPGYYSASDTVDPAYLDSLFRDPSALVGKLNGARQAWQDVVNSLVPRILGAYAGDRSSLDGAAANLLSPATWHGDAADEFEKQVRAVRDFALVVAANGWADIKGRIPYYQTLMSSDEAYQNPDFCGVLLECVNELGYCQQDHQTLQKDVASWANNVVNTWWNTYTQVENAGNTYTVAVPSLATGKPTAAMTLSFSGNPFDTSGQVSYVDQATGDRASGSGVQGITGDENSGTVLATWLVTQATNPKAFFPSYVADLQQILGRLTALYGNLSETMPQKADESRLPVLAKPGSQGGGGSGSSGSAAGLGTPGAAGLRPTASGSASYGNGKTRSSPSPGTATPPGAATAASGTPPAYTHSAYHPSSSAASAPGYSPVHTATVPATYTPGFHRSAGTGGLAGHTPGWDGSKLASYTPHWGGAGSYDPGALGAGGLAPGAVGTDPGAVAGAGSVGAGTGSEMAGAAGAGTAGRGMPMAPMGAAAGGKDGKERQRASFLPEDEDVWGAEGDGDAPAVL